MSTISVQLLFAYPKTSRSILYCLEEVGLIDSATVDKVLSEVGELK